MLTGCALAINTKNISTNAFLPLDCRVTLRILGATREQLEFAIPPWLTREYGCFLSPGLYSRGLSVRDSMFGQLSSASNKPWLITFWRFFALTFPMSSWQDHEEFMKLWKEQEERLEYRQREDLPNQTVSPESPPSPSARETHVAHPQPQKQRKDIKSILRSFFGRVFSCGPLLCFLFSMLNFPISLLNFAVST